MRESLKSILEDSPIVAGIKDDQGLEEALKSECKVIFILYGNLMSISKIVGTIKATDKLAFIHVDLLEGASHKDIVIDFLKATTKADGIISTKASMLKKAKEQGFYTVHRFFLIDSFTYHNMDKQILTSKPDCIEILPGGMPKVIGWVIDKINLPLIAGGLVCEKEDVVSALKAGATAISSTNTNVWYM